MGPIAVIGCAGKFAGAPDMNAYWAVLSGAGTPLREVPADRFDINAFYNETPRTGGKICSRCGGFLDQVDCFDHEFFGMSEREARASDPQQRLLLETSWAALEDAALAPSALSNSRTGVFFGLSTWDYNKILNTSTRFMSAYAATGSLLCMAANRLSHLLHFRGPSLAVDAACSSSLVAVHLGCQSLNSKESDLVIVGGANVVASPESSIVLSQAGVLATDGRCKTFDAAADGYVRSEGCAVFVLKRLADAQRARDPIWAVILGSAVNHSGHSNGITAPCGSAQQDLMRECLTRAAISPAEVTYVESHGTGTRVGDSIEVNALCSVYAPRGLERPLLAIGAAKAVVGHSEAAAGGASLLKVLLAMRYKRLPAQPAIRTINPLIATALKESSAHILTRPLAWAESSERRRIAAINAYSFGGVNAHLILEAPERHVPCVTRLGDSRSLLLPLSAKTESALRELALSAARWLLSSAASALSLGDICYTAQTGRDHFQFRYAAVGSDRAELVLLLNQFAGSNVAVRVTKRDAPAFGIDMHKDPVTLLSAAADAYCAGARIDWDALDSVVRTTSRRINGLPTYPFARHRHWVDATGGWHLLLHGSVDPAHSPVKKQLP